MLLCLDGLSRFLFKFDQKVPIIYIGAKHHGDVQRFTATPREGVEGKESMLSKEMLDRRTHNICIKRGFASEDQLERARREQQKLLQKTNSHMGIAEILVELGIITQDQKEAILFPKKTRKPAPEVVPPQEPPVRRSTRNPESPRNRRPPGRTK